MVAERTPRAFVDELILEGMGGPDIAYVRGHAEAVWRDVAAGAELSATDIARLCGLLESRDAFYLKQGRAGEYVRGLVVNSVWTHALRHEDVGLVGRLIALGPDVFTQMLRAVVPAAPGPCVVRAVVAASEGGDAKTALALNVFLERAPDAIAPLGEHLLRQLAIPAEGRGVKRVDVARSAAQLIFAALTRNFAHHTRWAPSAERAALAKAADVAFRPALEGLSETKGQAAELAHRTLIAVAALEDDWARIEGARGARARLTAAGLFDAVHFVLFLDERKAKVDPWVRAFLDRVIAHVSALRPRLKKSELGEVEEALTRLSQKHGKAVAPANGIRPMIDELLAAGAVKRRRIQQRLEAALRADPSLSRELPAIGEVKDGPLAEVAALHFIAIRAAGDPTAVAAHLDAVAKIPSARVHVLARLGNGSGRAPFASVVAPYLDDADPELRYWAVYFFRNLATQEGGELAPWAEAILRRTLDGERARSERVSVEGLRAWKAAVAATKKREALVAAAKSLMERVDATEKKLREVLRETLPEALAR